jgi:NTE family protein
MSPGTDTIIQNALERRNLQALFAALPLLRDLDPQQLRDISAEIEWFSLPGGATLFEAGQAADGLYAVVNGALGVYASRSSGGPHYVGQIVGGETVGEVEVISGRPRSATVIALRDTEVARLSIKSFELLVERNPQSMRQIARIMAQQLETLRRPRRQTRAIPKTFALVPHGPDVDASGFGSQLVECLRKLGRAELVVSARATEQTSHWFHRLERANDFVVYVTDARATNWTKLCLRQADSQLLLARLDGEPRPWPALAASQGNSPTTQCAELILLQPGPAGTCARWLEQQPCRRHHLVRNPADVARVARLLTGRGIGLVLGGGGARGFAHIGVLRALREAGVPVDAIGGTSIGAIIAAGWAAGWEHAEMVQRMRRSFADTNPLNDYTLPFVSLVAGRKVGRLLRQEFGAIGIEDLQLPFYCVSANLSSGQMAIHRRGELWLWLRASVSIPGVLPPVCKQGQVYVDGATINNLPADVMREVLDGTIIGVDVGTDRGFATDIEMTEVPSAWNIPAWIRGRRSRISIMQILWRASMIHRTATTVGQREQVDLLLRPPLEGIDMLDWRALERVIELGYRHAADILEKGLLRLAMAPRPDSATTGGSAAPGT